MHPRKRLSHIIRGVSSLIRDVEWWNKNRLDAPPEDCEVDRVVLSMAKRAARQWDAGDTLTAQTTMQEMQDYVETLPELKGL